MTSEHLAKCLKFLDKMGCDYSKDVIILGSGDLGIICNPNFEPKEFQGCCVWGVAEAVAKELGKTIEWAKDGEYDDET